jgi:hypothetical protein
MTSTKKELDYVCIMKLIKPYNLGGCSVGVIDGRDS